MADQTVEKKSNVDSIHLGLTDDLYSFLEKEGHFFIYLLQGVKTNLITLVKKVSIFSETKLGSDVLFDLIVVPNKLCNNKYSVDDVGRKLLMNDLIESLLLGGDIIASNGRGNKDTKSEIRMIFSHYKRHLGRKIIGENIIVGDHL